MNRSLTDDEIREIIVARKRAERDAKTHDRLLTLKVALICAGAVASIAMVWAYSWIGYALMM